MAHATDSPPQQLGGKRKLTLLDAVAQSVGFMGPVFSIAFLVPLLVGLNASGKGAGVAAQLAVLLAAIGVLALGWIVAQYARRIHAADGVPLSDRDFHNYFLLLIVAGNETTRHTITSTMQALIEHPEAWTLLKEQPDLLPGAVEEFLRWASPVYHFRRTATRDAELHGQPIKAGDKVVLWWASGNRDEAVFADPYCFDVRRDASQQMAFGKGGPHLCMGSQLARMEVRVMFEEILARVDSVAALGEPRRVRSNFVNGIKNYPVRMLGS